MKQYKATRREKTRAFEKVDALERELAHARESIKVLEQQSRNTVKAYAVAEAIIDEDADEKLLLRQKLKETVETLAETRVRVETQRETIESSYANERMLRDAILELEKQLARASSTRNKYRDTCLALEEAELRAEEFKTKHRKVEEECVMLAELVRELRCAADVDPREFLDATERAFRSRDLQSPRPMPMSPRIDRGGFDGVSPPPTTIPEIPTSPVTDLRVSQTVSYRPETETVALVDDDFPSPPISGIGGRSPLATPDSAASVGFHFV
jgi:hypothetical protein